MGGCANVRKNNRVARWQRVSARARALCGTVSKLRIRDGDKMELFLAFCCRRDAKHACVRVCARHVRGIEIHAWMCKPRPGAAT